MSEVNLQFTVNSYSTTLEVGSTELSFNPTSTNLSIYTGYTTFAPGGVANNTQVLYNDGGSLGSSTTLVFDKGIGKLTAGNITVSGKTVLGPVANVTITGGTTGQFLKTDGAGTLAFATLKAGGTTNQIQFNSANNFAGNSQFTYDPTSHVVSLVGNLNVTGEVSVSSNVTFAGSNITLGSNAAVHVSGGNVGDILSTDSYGTLSWIPQAGGTGSGVAGGATYAIQFNGGSGTFGGTQSLTYIPTTGTINIQQVAEKVTLNTTGSAGTINYDITTQSIITKTSNATANFTLNFRGSSTITLNNTMDVGRSMTCAFINKNGATGYYANAFQIDGTAITPFWFDGTAPGGGSANAYDTYTFNIIKTGDASFLLFASAARYA
jgi:hypothetical protein